ncbi:MAG: squalene--hopene cyclase, partial [candidate division NC10 bacterium]|nr:squalene--hopene cyclase [candidate division NC10 bacterium]
MDDLNRAIFKGCEYLLRRQKPSEGFWNDELEADSTLTSEYLLLRRFLEKTDPLKEQKAVNYLRDCQLPDGGWNIYYQGPSEISATVKAYLALKLAGISPQEPFMKRARQRVLEMGGIFNANVFTKITLALFGQYDWRWIPAIPVEIMLFPRSFYFNIYEMSYWSRTTLIPLMVITAHRPLYRLPEPYGLKELYPEPEGKPNYNYPRNREWLSWENFFLQFDTLLKVYEKSPLIRLRRRALEEAHRWIREHMQGEGGLGAIY